MHPSWHPDPTGRHELRYWDGSVWTDHVADQGVQSTDPLIPQADPTPQSVAAAEPTLDPSAMAAYGSHAAAEQESPEDVPEDVPGEASTQVLEAAEQETSEQSAGEPEASPYEEAAAEPEPEQPVAYAADPYGASGPVPQDAPPQAAPQQAASPLGTPFQAAAFQGAPFQGGPPQGAPPQGGPPQGGPPQGGPPQGAPLQAQAYSPTMGAAQGFTSDAFAGITGDLIDGRFSEKSGTGVERQNSRMLRVRVTEPFMARQGAMVAYQGDVRFNYQGGGAAKFLKKALTGEGLPLMRVEGSGDVFLADKGQHVHILNLRDTGISISGRCVLAFSAGLDWNIERVKGGSIAAGGLFNTMVRGTGWVAITTDGEPVVLDAGEAPTFADTDAIVAWSAHLQTSLKSSMSAGALIGRGSGEALQVTFAGQGFVIVQPSESGSVPPHTH